MTIQYSFNQPGLQPARPTLDKVLSRILWTFQPVAARHNSFIINDIDPGFHLGANEKMLEKTLSSLLLSVISRSQDSCIRISARRYNNIVLLHIKDSSGKIIYGLEEGLYHTQVMASRLGGCIMTNDLRKSSAMVTLTFVNATFAA